MSGFEVMQLGFGLVLVLVWRKAQCTGWKVGRLEKFWQGLGRGQGVEEKQMGIGGGVG